MIKTLDHYCSKSISPQTGTMGQFQLLIDDVEGLMWIRSRYSLNWKNCGISGTLHSIEDIDRLILMLQKAKKLRAENML